jgi:putative flavoprotein involved in K+ transport
MFDNPYIPVIPGLNEATSTKDSEISYSHARDWAGPASLKASQLLIIGGGMTAIELAEECVQAGLRPIMSFQGRQGRTFPARMLGVDLRFITYPLMNMAPLRLFRRQCINGWNYRGIDRGFELYCKQDLIDVRPRIQRVQGECVTFLDGTSAEIDHIVFATGYRWDMPFLPESTLTGARGNVLLKRGESISLPGLFCVGLPCAFSASSHFVHGITDDARMVARAVLRRHTGG